MRPPLWHPPIELSPAEQTILKRIRRAKLFVFLRQHRHTRLSDAFQKALATLYKEQPQGQPPVPPAQLALATLLQAYTQGSDDEGIEATTRDRRWQVVLDCLDYEIPPFSKGPLVAFRQRLIAQQLDRRLLERTIEVAATSGACGARQLRAALESRPLGGAGRVDDTYNLVGHALRQAVGVVARQPGRGLRAVAEEAGASLIAGASLKAALDLDGDDPGAQQQALPMILEALSAVEHWLETQPVPAETAPQVAATMPVGQQGRAQDVVPPPDGTPTLRQGVAAERRISIEDAEMRHGRKSRSLLVDGSKRHVLRDLDSRLIVAVGVTPANTPEARGTEAIETDLAAPQCTLRELHIDRASLASQLVHQRTETLAIFCKAWPGHQGPYCPKRAFQLDWERHELQCPGGVTMPCAPGGIVKFPAATCAGCALRPRGTSSASGRSVSMHPDEALWPELRERQQTPPGRAKLRERVAVEHALAHVGHWQGRRARYCGVRKKGVTGRPRPDDGGTEPSQMPAGSAKGLEKSAPQWPSGGSPLKAPETKRSRAMEKRTQTSTEGHCAPMTHPLNALKGSVEKAAQQGRAAHEVAAGIWHRVLPLGPQALERWFALVGPGDVGEARVLPAGRQGRRLEAAHPRGEQSICGRFDVARVVYGQRAGQKLAYVPVAPQWQRPESTVASRLPAWAPGGAVAPAYRRGPETVGRILEVRPSVDRLERMHPQRAKPGRPFRESRLAPEPETEGAVGVGSADGKGVPIRRPAPEAPMHAHAWAQAPKTNRQQLAVVGAVYTIAPWVRPPEAGAASLFRDPGAAPGLAKRPAPQPQRRWARLPHARGQSTGAATDEPLGWRAQVAQRNPTAAPPRGLMDGQQSWGEAGQRPFPPPQPVEILALLQATPRLGAAAHLVYRCDTAHALRWGDDRVRRILHGDVRAVVSGLRQMGTTRKRRGKQRDKLAALCGYLHNHAPRMRDEAYLAAGSPLAEALRAPVALVSRTVWSAPACAGPSKVLRPGWMGAVPIAGGSGPPA